MSGVASSSPSFALGEGVFVALKKCIKDYVFSFISIPEGAFERNFFRLDWIFPFGRKIYIFYTLSSSLHWKMILKWLIISLYEICYTIHNFLLHFCSFKLLIICLFKDNTFEFRQLFFQKSEKMQTCSMMSQCLKIIKKVSLGKCLNCCAKNDEIFYNLPKTVVKSDLFHEFSTNLWSVQWDYYLKSFLKVFLWENDLKFLDDEGKKCT